jgi:hypothetical protein
VHISHLTFIVPTLFTDYIVAGEHTRKNIIENAKLRSISVITRDRLHALLLGEINIKEL